MDKFSIKIKNIGHKFGLSQVTLQMVPMSKFNCCVIGHTPGQINQNGTVAPAKNDIHPSHYFPFQDTNHRVQHDVTKCDIFLKKEILSDDRVSFLDFE